MKSEGKAKNDVIAIPRTSFGRITEWSDSLLKNFMKAGIMSLDYLIQPFSVVPRLVTIDSSGMVEHWMLQGLDYGTQFRVISSTCNKVKACLAVYQAAKRIVLSDTNGDAEESTLCIVSYGATKNRLCTMIQPYKEVGSFGVVPLDPIEHDSTTYYMKMPWFDGIRWAAPSFCELKTQKSGEALS